MIEKKNKDIYISIYCFYVVYKHIPKHLKLGYASSNREIGLLAKINVDIIYLSTGFHLYPRNISTTSRVQGPLAKEPATTLSQNNHCNALESKKSSDDL